MSRDLTKLFSPRSIAVVGATEREGSVGASVFHNLLFSGFQGVVYPINVRAKHIYSVHAYPSMSDLNETVDLAVMCVPPPAIIQSMEECKKLGTKNVIVISAGFKEIGAEGLALEQEVKKIAQSAGINVLGPNCLGLINPDPAVGLNASFAISMPRFGNLGFISQSGALGTAVLDYATGKGIGFSKFISFGNKCDVDECDLLEYLANDPSTDVIAMYLEDLTRARTFIELAREITGERKKSKPILAIKTGRTPQGAAAAASHTGSLAGSDEVYDALFAQAGVLRVDTVEDLFDFAIAFSKQPLPKGNRIGIVTNAGGPGIMTTDACIRQNLQVPPMSDDVRARLKEVLPPTAATRNPVDVIGDARRDRYQAAIAEAIKDPAIDSLIVLITPQTMTDVAGTAEEIAAAAAEQAKSENPKPILACLMGDAEMQKGIKILNDNKVPAYKFPESAVRSLGAMVRYEQWRLRPRTEIVRFDVDKAAAKAVIDKALCDGRTQLPEIEALELLKAYGFPVPAFGQAADPAEAVDVAEKIGYPVVLKISSPDILHKTDVGGVKLNLATAEDVHRAATELIATAKAHAPNARIWGVTVAPMAKSGREVILGVTRDPQFGPILMFGLGGIYTEVLKDVSFRLAPIREIAPQNMVNSIRTRKLLDGVRGQAPADKPAIYDALERLSQLVTDFPQIKEMDINPMFVYPEGEGALAVDARIILSEDN